jgi:hypothetical protein
MWSIRMRKQVGMVPKRRHLNASGEPRADRHSPLHDMFAAEHDSACFPVLLGILVRLTRGQCRSVNGRNEDVDRELPRLCALGLFHEHRALSLA